MPEKPLRREKETGIPMAWIQHGAQIIMSANPAIPGMRAAVMSRNSIQEAQLAADHQKNSLLSGYILGPTPA